MSDEQDHPGRGGDAGTERALDELRVALEQLATRMGAGFREDLAQIRAIATAIAERDLTADVEALRADVAALVGRDRSEELRDDVAALRVEVARLASADDVAAGVRSGLGPLQSAVDRITTRLDETAGADVGADVLARLDALAARLEQLPTAQQVANLSGDLRAHLADALGGFDGDTALRELGALRAQLGGEGGTLVEQLQDNLADVASGEVVGALWDEVRAVRSELADGLVVEPSDPLSASLESLTVELDGLREAVAELRDAPPAPAPQPTPTGPDDEVLIGQLAAVQAGIDDLRARLDEGVALAEGAAPAVPAAPPVPPEPVEVRATIDPATIASLRDEIRAAGAIPDQVIDALREELKALRRRIAVKASERVLDDQQLAQIADAVAARLAEDRDPA